MSKRLEPKHPRKNNPYSREYRYYGEGDKNFIKSLVFAAFDSYRNEQSANREQEKRENDSGSRLEIWTLFFVICTFGGIVVQDFILSNTDQTTKDAYVASSRPWVKMTSTIVDKIEIQKDQVSISARFEVKNIGHSPAQKVTVSPKLLLPEMEPWAWREAKSVCEGIKNHPNMLAFGPAIYPDEPFETDEINFGRPISDINTSILSNFGRQYAGWLSTFGQSEADRNRDVFLKFSKYTTFSLAVCTTYVFAGDVHQATNIFRLTQSPTLSERGDSFDLTKIGAIKGSDVVVTPIQTGTYAD